MRIVHVTPYYYPVVGGGQTHIKELSERLARRGHEVSVFTQNRSDVPDNRDHPPFPKTEIINGVTVKRFTPLRFPRTLLQVRGSGFLLRTINSDYLTMCARGPHMPQLIAETIRSGPDVVAVLSWFLPAVPYHIRLAKRSRRFAFVGIPLFHTEQKWAHVTVYPKLLAQCDAVLVNTEHEGRFVDSLVPGKREVHVVGVGISPAEFVEPHGGRIRARYGLEGFPIVGFVGRMIPTKGAGKLAQAMRIVWQSNKQVRLVLAGPMGTSDGARRMQEGLLGDLSAEDRSRIVQIPDFADEDKASIFDAFDIFAMPSTGESFGITYLEAWMCRKPVIGSQIGAIRCVIREGVDGLLVDPENPVALAEAILKLLQDPEKRERMGQAGYEKTLAQYTWERITDKVETIYSHITSMHAVKHTADVRRGAFSFRHTARWQKKI